MKKNSPLSLIIGISMAFTLVGCGGGAEGDKEPSPSHMESASPVSGSSSASHGDDSSHGEDDGHGHGYSTGEKDARSAAASLVSMGAFSRAFTISQLTSPGEGYSEAEATKAVDSLHIAWREQARRAAIEYMGIRKFTCEEMKEQLAATYANNFTREEAKWGAEHSPACQGEKASTSSKGK